MAPQLKTIPHLLWTGFSKHTPDEGSSFFRKTAWNTVASIANMVSRLIASVMIARSLGTEGTGWIAFLMWASETTTTLFAAGIPESLPRYLAELSKRPAQGAQLARWIFGRYSLQSLAAVLLMGISATFWMSPHFEPGLAWAFSMMLATRFLSGLYQSFLTGLQRFDLLARVNILSSFLLLIGVSLGVWKWGVSGALLGYALGTLFPTFLSFQMFQKAEGSKGPDIDLRQRFWNYAIFIWISNILGAFVWARMEVFFLHRYWSDSEVSLFSVPQTVSGLILNLAAMLSGAFMPYFAELSGAQNLTKIHSVFGSGNRILAFILFPVCFGGAALMPVLFPLVYGHKFDAAIPNTIVLFAASFITFGNISTALITGLDRSRFLATITFIAALLSVLAGFMIIRPFGSWGAVWSRSVIQTGSVLVSYLYIEKALGCPVPFMSLGRLMLSAILCGLTAGMILHFSPNVNGLFPAILAGALVYCTGVRIFGGLEPLDAAHLERIVKRFPGPIRKAGQKLLLAIVPRPRSRV